MSRTLGGGHWPDLGVTMVMVVPVVVRIAMRVPMIAITWMRVSDVQAGEALCHSEQVGQDAGDDRGDHAGNGAKHRHQRIGECVCQADAVGPGLWCRNEEGDCRSRRRPFPAQADRRR